MSNQGKIFSLTILILVLATAVWGMTYYWQWKQHPPIAQPNLDSHAVSQGTFNRPDTTSTEALVTDEPGTVKPSAVLGLASASSASPSLELGMDGQNILTNPFPLKGRMSGYTSLDWQLQDGGGKVLGQGSLAPESDGSFDALGWYDAIPQGKAGSLLVIDPASPSSAPVRSWPVKLQTKTQSVEAYFFKGELVSGCEDVFPLKRTIVAVGDDRLAYYQAALNVLMRGLDETEQNAGWRSFVPAMAPARLLGVSQDQKGRYVADFDHNILQATDDEDSCSKVGLRAQIEHTLTSVYLPGASLMGRLYIDGQPADF